MLRSGVGLTSYSAACSTADSHDGNRTFDDKPDDRWDDKMMALRLPQGLTLNVPEMVPFRLTQNMIDAFGVAGHEGVFRCVAPQDAGSALGFYFPALSSVSCTIFKRKTDVAALLPAACTQYRLQLTQANSIIPRDKFRVQCVAWCRRACEVTLGVLRGHKDTLMSVLETFVYDPFVDWTQVGPALSSPHNDPVSFDSSSSSELSPCGSRFCKAALPRPLDHCHEAHTAIVPSYCALATHAPDAASSKSCNQNVNPISVTWKWG